MIFIMRILLLGNSQHFNHLLILRLTNSPDSPSTVTVRLADTLHVVEVAVGASEIEASGVWGIEAIQSDGIIYALVPENDLTWVIDSSPSEFLSALNRSNIQPFRRPSILVSSHRSIFQRQLLPRVHRQLEIDPATGENCLEALLSVVYWAQ